MPDAHHRHILELPDATMQDFDHSNFTDALPRHPEHLRIELLARDGSLRAGSAAGPDAAINMQPTRIHAVVNQHLQARRAAFGEDVGMVQSGEHIGQMQRAAMGRMNSASKQDNRLDKLDCVESLPFLDLSPQP